MIGMLVNFVPRVSEAADDHNHLEAHGGILYIAIHWLVAILIRFIISHVQRYRFFGYQYVAPKGVPFAGVTSA